eukprot:8278015-Alexandrium_andersonii.AAC.1
MSASLVGSEMCIRDSPPEPQNTSRTPPGALVILQNFQGLFRVLWSIGVTDVWACAPAARRARACVRTVCWH